ncbi:hypothetical protein CY34DRAFT_603561 [Suillus luteus UH-Slu-Lm8-n1]|uniref:Uncharacterized protein n=1 Tax=Suillus luteus UH-Slu-Lm8-n1 TaxID=930992 RepID=A0A0D0BF28_9AGAM|nr:hypothetical protein CY34DRAFT_603561 [Suillus luteus UH-Slu-Lm8-n1]
MPPFFSLETRCEARRAFQRCVLFVFNQSSTFGNKCAKHIPLIITASIIRQLPQVSLCLLPSHEQAKPNPYLFTAVGHRGARGRLWKPPSRSVYFDLLPSVPLRTSSPTLWDEINDISHSNATKGILIILIGSFSREMLVEPLLW